MPCRAILDSASQLNFITSRLASELNLNYRRSQTSISGIGESSMISDKTIAILVQSRDASYREAFTAVVTHSITDYQPHFNINATSYRKTFRSLILISINHKELTFYSALGCFSK